MTLGQVLDELKAILDVHPDAVDATVWADSTEVGHRFQVKTISYDNRHKPRRIKFYD